MLTRSRFARHLPCLRLMLAMALVPALGCGESEESIGNPQTGDYVESNKQRVTSPQVGPTDVAQLVGGNSSFAFDLYQAVRQGQQGNLFYSPYSISLALAMTYAGARGTTEAEMQKACRFALPQSSLHPAFNALDLELASRGKGAQGKDGGKFRLNIANATFGQRGTSFLPSFLDTLAQSYGAGMYLLDFIKQPEAARLFINDWVSKETESRIKDLIPEGAIDPTTRLVLTNAIYFNAAWEDKFDAKLTQNADFNKLDGSKVSAPMMNKEHEFGYARTASCEAVQIPYDGKELSMVLLVPPAGSWASFEASLSAQAVESIVGQLQSGLVNLTLPKFKVETQLSLTKTLRSMGLDDVSDFSGMTGTRELSISEVIHKAWVEIDEAGTEAAAATAVVMAGSAPGERVTVHIDRPFLFVIRDNATGAILFVGRVLDPTA